MKRQQNTKGFYILHIGRIQKYWDKLTDDEFIYYANKFMSEMELCIAFNNGELYTQTQVIRYI